MHATVPCPVCRHTLTFVTMPLGLACPFCRTSIRFPNDKVPVGEKVRCDKCKGVFTAESPPPVIRIFASTVRPCPHCHATLTIRDGITAGKLVRCPKCRMTFPHAPPDGPPAPAPPPAAPPPSPPAPAPALVRDEAPPHAQPPQPPPERRPDPVRKTASGTLLVLGRKPAGSSRTQLAPRAYHEEQSNGPPLGAPATDDDVDFGLVVPKKAPPARQEPTKAPPVAPDSSDEVDFDLPVPKQKSPAPAPVVDEPQTRRLGPRARKPAAKKPAPKAAPRAPARKAAGAALPLADATKQRKAAPTQEAPAHEAPAAKKPPAEPKKIPLMEELEQQPEPEPEPRPTPRPTLPVRSSASSDDGESGIGWRTLAIGAGVLLLIGLGVYLIFFAGLFPAKVYPVEGVAFYKGKPLAGALVVLHPDKPPSDNRFPTGVVNQDGTFKLTTRTPDDGAPAGRYRVSIRRGDGGETIDPRMGGSGKKGKQPKTARLPTKYANPDTSGLEAVVTRGGANFVELKIE